MSFLCTGSPEYSWSKKVKALEPHVFQQWWNRVPGLREEIQRKRGVYGQDHAPINQANFPDVYLNGEGMLMDEQEVQAWNEIGISIEVKRIKGLATNARELAKTIFQVCIAGVGPMQIQCVDYIKGEDGVDDWQLTEVNRWIAKGWRILAVVPPADCKFPTFVMGHMEKEPHR